MPAMPPIQRPSELAGSGPHAARLSATARALAGNVNTGSTNGNNNGNVNTGDQNGNCNGNANGAAGFNCQGAAARAARAPALP